jgi:hypothetical protein
MCFTALRSKYFAGQPSRNSVTAFIPVSSQNVAEFGSDLERPTECAADTRIAVPNFVPTLDHKS